MSEASLYRLSGLSLIIGAVLSGVTSLLNIVLFSGNDPTPYAHNALFVPINVVAIAAITLAMLGMPGTYALHARRAGVLGLVGTVLLFFSALAPVFFTMFSALVIPYTVDKAPELFKGTTAPPAAIIVFITVLSLTLIASLTLLGITMLKRQAWSPTLGVVFLVAAVVSMLSFVVGIATSGNSALSAIVSVLFNIALSIALAWWGWFAWTLERPAESVPSGASQPVRA